MTRNYAKSMTRRKSITQNIRQSMEFLLRAKGDNVVGWVGVCESHLRPHLVVHLLLI
jgi:hypothetical protein